MLNYRRWRKRIDCSQDMKKLRQYLMRTNRREWMGKVQLFACSYGKATRDDCHWFVVCFWPLFHNDLDFLFVRNQLSYIRHKRCMRNLSCRCEKRKSAARSISNLRCPCGRMVEEDALGSSLDTLTCESRYQNVQTALINGCDAKKQQPKDRRRDFQLCTFATFHITR